MLDVLQYRDVIGLKSRACATHGLPAHILKLLCLQLHILYEVLLSVEVCNERCQRRRELLIQKNLRNPARSNPTDDLRIKSTLVPESPLAQIESQDPECDQSCCGSHQLQFPQEYFATLGIYSRKKKLQIC